MFPMATDSYNVDGQSGVSSRVSRANFAIRIDSRNGLKE